MGLLYGLLIDGLLIDGLLINRLLMHRRLINLRLTIALAIIVITNLRLLLIALGLAIIGVRGTIRTTTVLCVEWTRAAIDSATANFRANDCPDNCA
jgi:hypothetical protein